VRLRNTLFPTLSGKIPGQEYICSYTTLVCLKNNVFLTLSGAITGLVHIHSSPTLKCVGNNVFLCVPTPLCSVLKEILCFSLCLVISLDKSIFIHTPLCVWRLMCFLLFPVQSLKKYIFIINTLVRLKNDVSNSVRRNPSRVFKEEYVLNSVL